MTAKLEIKDDVAIISLDDGKANAFGHIMIDAVNSALDEAEKSAKSVLIVGRDGRFSAGFDLSIMRDGSPEDQIDLLHKGGELCLRLFTFPLPVVMACTGHALALGGMLLLCGDSRIGMDGEFKIGLNETAIGMALPVFGIELPRARIDPRFFTRCVIQAEIFDPDVAQEVSFLDKVVAPEDLMETAMEEAKRMGALPAKAYLANKLAIRAGAIERIKAGQADLAKMKK